MEPASFFSMSDMVGPSVEDRLGEGGRPFDSRWKAGKEEKELRWEGVREVTGSGRREGSQNNRAKSSTLFIRSLFGRAESRKPNKSK